ncbi:MAG: histidine phosphotransferase family protein [Alphaproteobacteria bacterium]|nr:histidine phosphotransferase family protein [Alphaproteobacteria bacterium]
MDRQNQTALAQLLCSRLCHDLISPVSAINSGLELLEESGAEFLDDALPLVGRSAEQSKHFLSFFRAAFGSGGAPADWKEQRSLAINFLQFKKVSLVWDGCGQYESEPMGKELSRLIINLILLGAECLPSGGTLQMHLAALPEGLGLGLLAKGPKANFRDDLRAVMDLSYDINNLTARTVQAYYVMNLADQVNSTIEIIATEDDTIEIATLIAQ